MENKDEQIVDVNKMKNDTPTLVSSFSNLDETEKIIGLALIACVFGDGLFADNDDKGEE